MNFSDIFEIMSLFKTLHLYSITAFLVPFVTTTTKLTTTSNNTASSTTLKVLMTTLLPITTTRALLTCTASLSNLNWHYPCGNNTVCFTDLSTSAGVHCECASGYVGNASAGCTNLNVPIKATRVLQGSLRFPVAWQIGLNDSTSAAYQTAITPLVSLLEKLMSPVVGYVHISVSPKKFRFALCELMSTIK